MVSATGEFAERPTTFMPDLPDLREFPIRTWLRLLNETSGRLTGQILAEASNAGYEPLRRAIAQHVSASRGMKCESRQVIVTSGSQQGLDLICRMLIDTGDPVWLDEPGYRGAQSVLKANGAALCPWPMHRGIPDAADALAGHPTPRLIFVAPSRHYPLGTNISLEQRKVLLDIAHRSGAWIVEDDYDNEFIYDGNGLRSIFGMDTQARTIYMGTFSKTLLPSFRLGYLVVPNDLSEHFARARAVIDRHASLIEQMVLSEFMNKGLFASHIRRMRNLYQHRRAHLVHGLEELFGYDCRTGSPAGGTHVILPLIREAADHEIVAKAASRNIVLRALSPYYMTSSCEQGLLLGFSAFNETEIAKGLHALSGLRAEILPYVSVGFRA